MIMTQIKEVKQCYNCGCPLQCENEDEPGYISKEVLESQNQSFYFCNECFLKERHSKRSNEPLVSDDLLTLLKDAKKKNALIVYVVNLFSFECSFSSKINEIIKDMNILVVASKADLLPKGSDDVHLRKFINYNFLNSGLKVKASNIMIESAFDDETIRAVGSKIYELKGNNDVYVIGAKLSGKTTLISSFLKGYKNVTKYNIVTDNYPNTNIRVMKIPLNKHQFIYDVTGIDDTNSILHNLDKATLRNIYLTEEVIKRNISISSLSALFIGGLALISVLKDDKKHKLNLSLYFHNDIELKKVPSHNYEQKFIDGILKNRLVPSLKSIKSIKDLDIYELEMEEGSSKDINIQGLGWLSYIGHGEIIRIYVPKGVSICLTQNKIKEKKNK